MKFEKINNNGTVEYYINDKLVPESTYNTLVNDEAVSQLPYNKSKITNEEYTNSEFNIEDDEDYCDCPECQELYEIVGSIQDMDFDTAVAVLRQYFDDFRTDIRLSTMIESYEQLGQSLLKVSGKLESELENHMSKYDVDIEEYFKY